MASDATVTRYLTRGGLRIYGFRVETFPNHFNNIYLILDGPHSTLFDVGSGLPDSNAGLEAAMHARRERHGESLRLEQVRHVVISHAHVDHFGHVGYFGRHTEAQVYVRRGLPGPDGVPEGRAAGAMAAGICLAPTQRFR